MARIKESLLELLGSLLSLVFRRPSPYIDRKVANEQILGPDWAEIELDQPLKPIGDYQEIGLYLAEPFEMDLLGPLGVRVSDGSLVLPEVELITGNGSSVDLRCCGSRGKKSMTYRLKDESIKQDYDRIRIRADHEVPLEAIYWSGVIIKNMP